MSATTTEGSLPSASAEGLIRSCSLTKSKNGCIPDVLHLLLQLLEDGRLTDAQGHTCSFKNSVLIMTSNIGARKITDRTSLGFADPAAPARRDDTIRREVMTELKKTFKPELLNRIDEIVVFLSLGGPEMLRIARAPARCGVQADGGA